MDSFLLANDSRFLRELADLVSAESVRDLSTAMEGAPFGMGVRDAMDRFKGIAEAKGFEVEGDAGYAISASVGVPSIDDPGDYVGILGHLDVVSAGLREEWSSDPFVLRREGDMLYGRGVNDDKGPLLAALWAAWWVAEFGPRLARPVRVIAGGAEETTWECVSHFFSGHPQPRCAFSPDGDFPVVNGEKGILQVRIEVPIQEKGLLIESYPGINYVCDKLDVSSASERRSYSGTTALSRHPERGENAIGKFLSDEISQRLVGEEAHELLAFLRDRVCPDPSGALCGLDSHDDEMGDGSLCPMTLETMEDPARLSVSLDIRWVRSTTEGRLVSRLQEIASSVGGALVPLRSKPLLYVNPSTSLIKVLRKSYSDVAGEDPKPITKGGASYARALKCGVAYGATFPGEDPRPHMPNERQSLSSLGRAFEIYRRAIIGLACR